MARHLTNKYNLPDTLVKAVEYDTHRLSGTISVTTLIDGARIRQLKSIHDYESDVSENIYALLGTALHHVLERANIQSVTKRAYITVAEHIIGQASKIKEASPEKSQKLLSGGNWIFSLIPVFFPETTERYIFEKTMQLPVGEQVISGTFDLYDKTTGILYDYKFCSVYQFMSPESREKWVEQTNIYAYMLRNEGFPVNGIRIVAFFRDWSAYGGMKNRNYPPMQIMEIHIDLWDNDKTRILIYKHINLHNSAEAGNVPDCDGKTRWATADQYAVIPKTKGVKRAINGGIFDTMEGANRFIAENKHKHTNELYVEVRPGSSKRCESYCPVSKHCPQYKAELQRIEILEKG